MKHLTILITLCLFSCNYLWSQGDDVSANSNMYFNFNLLPAQTKIINNGVYNSPELKQSPGFTFSGSVEIGLNLNKRISIVTGLGLSSYSSKLNMDNYSNKYNSVDSENDNFEMQIAGSGIIEKQKVTCLVLPAKAQYIFFSTKKLALFVNSGIKVSLPMSKKYTGSGIFDYQGYYPAYNITFFNLPAHGFPENVNMENSDVLKVKSFNLNFTASAGFIYMLNKKLSLAISLYYDQSLGSISNYATTDFQLSKQPDDYNSLMSSTSDVKLRAMGSAISLRINL